MFVQSRGKDVARLLMENSHHQIEGFQFHLLGRGVLGRTKLHSFKNEHYPLQIYQCLIEFPDLCNRKKKSTFRTNLQNITQFLCDFWLPCMLHLILFILLSYLLQLKF